MTENCEKDEKQDAHLKKVLGVFNGVSMIVGVTVGSSIFITPGRVLQNSGSVGVCLLMWLVGGLFATIGALFSAELGVRYKTSGEKYLYLKRLCGYFPAYIYLWQYITLYRPASNSLKALVFSRYFLKCFFLHCKIPEMAIKLISTVVVCFFGVLNSLSVPFFANVQMFMTMLTVMTIILISTFGLVPILQGDSDNLSPFFGNLPTPSSLIQAFSSAVFGYFGWNALNFVVDELREPRRTLPLAIISSTTLITVLYVMVNISYILLLGFKEMVASEAVAMSATAKILGTFSWLASILISLNAASSINTSIMIGSRLTLVGAANGEVPRCLSLISVRRFTPIMSIFFQCSLTIIFLWISSVGQMINTLMFGTIVFEFLVVISYIKVRVVESLFGGEKLQNTKNNLFMVPIMLHVIYGVLLFFVISISLLTNAQSFANGFLYSSLISLLYYFLFIYMDKPSLFLKRYIDSFTVFSQKLFMSVTPVNKQCLSINQS